MPLPRKKKAGRQVIPLGHLDSKTRLAATPYSFVLQKRISTKEGGMWASQYYYSELLDAVKGYVRHLLRDKETMKDVQGDVQKLINKLEVIEQTVEKVGASLSDQFNQRFQDPIEAAFLKRGPEVEDE